MVGMARPLRINRAGIWFHVAGRGTDRQDIFIDDSHWRHWLKLLLRNCVGTFWPTTREGMP